ncbi:MAG: bifunctional riboflavin kinase/FAD synthetase [Gemmataceae bacterium]
MRTIHRDPAGAPINSQGSVVAIGAFDGVHRGHQALLDAMRVRAHELGLVSVALSFEPLPRQFFQGRQVVARLSSPGERAVRLAEHADQVMLSRFDAALAHTAAEDWVRDVLVGRVNAREVWVGPGFRFGHARRGDFAMLEALGKQYGYTARTVAPVLDNNERISSSRIRAALAGSAFDEAHRLLGRPYAMTGHVVRGLQLGRRLGYPTANLRIPFGRAPLAGIFAVRVGGDGLPVHGGVASLGTRPTVGGVEPLLEAHLFDYEGDLYGRRISVEFVDKLRDEAKFGSLDAMVEQIHADAAQARRIVAAS